MPQRAVAKQGEERKPEEGERWVDRAKEGLQNQALELQWGKIHLGLVFETGVAGPQAPIPAVGVAGL